MPEFRRFEWNSVEYSGAFESLLRCSSERSVLLPHLRQQLDQLSESSVAADWGAGTGDLTSLLAESCATTYAIEPSEPMQHILQENVPGVQLIEGDVTTACPPSPTDYALLAHVLYHLPDEEWSRIVNRLLTYLNPSGKLVIVMKGRESGCNAMLEYFGAPRFDIIKELTPSIEGMPGFQLEVQHLPATIATDNFADTEAIARFMMSDRNACEFTIPPQEPEFLQYVKANFWNPDRNRGGWDYDLAVMTIKRR